jgi:hypothetical protein
MSGILASIASLGVGELAKGVGSLAKDIRTALTGEMSPEQRERLQAQTIELQVLAQQQEAKVAALQHNVIVAEAQGESWLQRNWRPVTMLTFVGIIANNYIIAPYMGAMFGKSIYLEIPPDMWDLLKLGIGGYIVSRGVENGIKKWKDKEVNKT